MKRFLLLSLLITVLILSLASCGKSCSINGVDFADCAVVYSESDTDYAKRAAEYVRDMMEKCSGGEVALVTDAQASGADYEIVVGETSRDISKRLDAECEGVEFAILSEESAIALKGDYFVIAAAAYYFIDTYIGTESGDKVIPLGESVCTPVVKEAKNYILLIGDGMGLYQTKLHEYLTDTSDYSDGEDLFYGYMLPYIGSARTTSLSGITDSAAAATALATGNKTKNKTIGLDKDGNELLSITELALSLGMSAGVMSTEDQMGATPAAFSAHTTDRDNDSEILDDQDVFVYEKGGIIECNYNQYSERGIAYIEDTITKTLDKLDDNEKGFFLMYEEAHVDKHCSSGNLQDAYLALLRFNQAIATFMEYVFYHPDTFLLITADHETGGLSWMGYKFSYNSGGHTSRDVPVYAYGVGAEVFHDLSVENVQIPKTIVSWWGAALAADTDEEYPVLK